MANVYFVYFDNKEISNIWYAAHFWKAMKSLCVFCCTQVEELNWEILEKNVRVKLQNRRMTLKYKITAWLQKSAYEKGNMPATL